MKHIISALVENRPGVLAHVAGSHSLRQIPRRVFPLAECIYFRVSLKYSIIINTNAWESTKQMIHEFPLSFAPTQLEC